MITHMVELAQFGLKERGDGMWIDPQTVQVREIERLKHRNREYQREHRERVATGRPRGRPPMSEREKIERQIERLKKKLEEL